MPSQICTFSRSAMRVLTPAILVAGMALLTSGAAVAEWRIEPFVGVGFEYDDNAPLASSSALKESASGYTVSAKTDFLYRTELTNFAIIPELLYKRFDGNSDFDLDEQFLRIRFNRRSQLANYGFRARYSDESVRVAERSNVDFEIEDPGEIPADDSGRLGDKEDRQRIQLAPYWSYRLGPRTDISFNANYIDTSYDGQTVTTFNEFTTTRVAGSLGRDITERDTVSLIAYSQTSDFEADNREVSGRGAALGYSRVLSEVTRLQMNVGVDRTEDETGQDQSNPVGSFSIIRRMETGRLLLAYQRRIEGSGSGNVQVRDLVNVNGTRDLGERSRLSLGVRAYRTDSLGDNGNSIDERNYVQFRGLYSWRATRNFTIDFEYRYTYQDRRNLGLDADANQLNLWFVYNPVL